MRAGRRVGGRNGGSRRKREGRLSWKRPVSFCVGQESEQSVRFLPVGPVHAERLSLSSCLTSERKKRTEWKQSEGVLQVSSTPGSEGMCTRCGASGGEGKTTRESESGRKGGNGKHSPLLHRCPAPLTYTCTRGQYWLAGGRKRQGKASRKMQSRRTLLRLYFTTLLERVNVEEPEGERSQSQCRVG